VPFSILLTCSYLVLTLSYIIEQDLPKLSNIFVDVDGFNQLDMIDIWGMEWMIEYEIDVPNMVIGKKSINNPSILSFSGYYYWFGLFLDFEYISTLIIGENSLNNSSNALEISSFPYLEELVIHKNSLNNIQSLKITDNPVLKVIEVESGNPSTETCENVTFFTIKSTFYIW